MKAPGQPVHALSALLLVLALVGLPAQSAAQELDLTGEWVLTVSSPNGIGERKVLFVQEDNELTGEISSARAEGPLTGTIDGNEVTFVAIVEMESGPFEIFYTGTIDGDEIEGIVEFGSYGTGTFTGHRVSPPSGP